MCGLISFYDPGTVNPTRSREKIILLFVVSVEQL